MGPMPRRPLSIGRRSREHGAVLQHADRRQLERDGWRTTLEYRENHRRGREGRLLQVTAVWHAEAERDPLDRSGRRGVEVISASAGNVEAVWTRLRLAAELVDVRAVDPPPSPTVGGTVGDAVGAAELDVRERAELVLARGGRH
jgi:hypothetical protein